MEERNDQNLCGRFDKGEAEIHDFAGAEARTYRSTKARPGVSLPMIENYM